MTLKRFATRAFSVRHNRGADPPVWTVYADGLSGALYQLWAFVAYATHDDYLWMGDTFVIEITRKGNQRMGSHHDRDSGIEPHGLRQMFERLDRRADAMSRRGENLITAGLETEEVLFDERRDGVTVRRLPDDPDEVLRVSIGCPEANDNLAYVVVRGDPIRVGVLFERALRAFRECGVVDGKA